MYTKQHVHKILDDMESQLTGVHVGMIPFEISYDYKPNMKSARFKGPGVPSKIVFVVNNKFKDEL